MANNFSRIERQAMQFLSGARSGKNLDPDVKLYARRLKTYKEKTGKSRLSATEKNTLHYASAGKTQKAITAQQQARKLRGKAKEKALGKLEKKYTSREKQFEQKLGRKATEEEKELLKTLTAGQLLDQLQAEEKPVIRGTEPTKPKEPEKPVVPVPPVKLQIVYKVNSSRTGLDMVKVDERQLANPKRFTKPELPSNFDWHRLPEHVRKWKRPGSGSLLYELGWIMFAPEGIDFNSLVAVADTTVARDHSVRELLQAVPLPGLVFDPFNTEREEYFLEDELPDIQYLDINYPETQIYWSDLAEIQEE